ncbi:Protein of unknown function DUF674, partial [Dillenia turbinata]
MVQTRVELKLLIHTKARKVLFAEAGKDFLLVLPVGTVIRLLSKTMTGSFGTLYESIENLSETYMQPNLDKDILLKPKPSFSSSGSPQLLSHVKSSSKKFYVCSNYHGYISDTNQAICSSYGARYVPPTSLAASSSSSSSHSEGYVKGVVTYMVMDDLTVKPMSTISSVTLLNKFNVKEICALEEKTVVLRKAEIGLKLLREALQSKDVLTNVFLVGKILVKIGNHREIYKSKYDITEVLTI